MNVKIQAVHFDADEKLVAYVNRKLEKLNTFHDRILKVDVFLKLDNVVHNIKDKIAEIKVHVPRHDFFVKASSKSFEESFDNALDSIANTRLARSSICTPCRASSVQHHPRLPSPQAIQSPHPHLVGISRHRTHRDHDGPQRI